MGKQFFIDGRLVASGVNEQTATNEEKYQFLVNALRYASINLIDLGSGFANHLLVRIGEKTGQDFINEALLEKMPTFVLDIEQGRKDRWERLDAVFDNPHAGHDNSDPGDEAPPPLPALES